MVAGVSAAGRIVNVVSVLGHVTAPLQAPYCTVKYGVEAFSDCLRSEMRRWGVDVVVVEPGDYTTGRTPGRETRRNPSTFEPGLDGGGEGCVCQ